MILWLNSPHLFLVKGYRLLYRFLATLFIPFLGVAISIMASVGKNPTQVSGCERATASWATLALNLRFATSPFAVTFADSRVLRRSPRIFSSKRETANKVIVRECSTVSLDGKTFGELTYEFGLFFFPKMVISIFTSLIRKLNQECSTRGSKRVLKIITITLNSFWKKEFCSYGYFTSFFGCALWLFFNKRTVGYFTSWKNFNAQYFLMSIYGYFTSLQKSHHPGLAFGCLVVTNARTNQLAKKWLTYQFSTQEERKPLDSCKEKIDWLFILVESLSYRSVARRNAAKI